MRHRTFGVDGWVTVNTLQAMDLWGKGDAAVGGEEQRSAEAKLLKGRE